MCGEKIRMRKTHRLYDIRSPNAHIVAVGRPLGQLLQRITLHGPMHEIGRSGHGRILTFLLADGRISPVCTLRVHDGWVGEDARHHRSFDRVGCIEYGGKVRVGWRADSRLAVTILLRIRFCSGSCGEGGDQAGDECYLPHPPHPSTL